MNTIAHQKGFNCLAYYFFTLSNHVYKCFLYKIVVIKIKDEYSWNLSIFPLLRYCFIIRFLEKTLKLSFETTIKFFVCYTHHFVFEIDTLSIECILIPHIFISFTQNPKNYIHSVNTKIYIYNIFLLNFVMIVILVHGRQSFDVSYS